MVDDNACGLTGRMLTLLTVTTALILSIVASFNCNFLKFENDSGESWEGLEPPFDGSIEAHVGIFGYEIIDHMNETMVTTGCQAYDEKFSSGNFEAVITAQFCAVFAPVIGVIGLIVSCMDTCLCRFFGSFLVSSALFLLACGIQAGTFSLYAEPDFCFNGNQYCNVGISVYMSGASSALFFCGCLFLCCFPTPDPMFGPKQYKGPPARGTQENIVIQPVVIDQRRNPRDYDYEEEEYEESSAEDEDEDDESYDEEAPRQPTKKNSMVSNTGDKITDDDFNFESPTEGTSRVDYKERTLPDGTRQVDEITYHPDGTKTIKTKSYDK